MSGQMKWHAANQKKKVARPLSEVYKIPRASAKTYRVLTIAEVRGRLIKDLTEKGKMVIPDDERL
jgi:hypothetical protein